MIGRSGQAAERLVATKFFSFLQFYAQFFAFLFCSFHGSDEGKHSQQTSKLARGLGDGGSALTAVPPDRPVQLRQ
jgi:hypothetical protein